jgi:hypothetical protein
VNLKGIPQDLISALRTLIKEYPEIIDIIDGILYPPSDISLCMSEEPVEDC